MQPLLAFARAVDRFNRRVATAMAWLMLLMVLVGAWNAIGRDLGKRLDVRLTSNALLELQWYLFGLAFLLGAPYALRRAAHVRVDVLYGGLAERTRLWIDLVGTVLLLLPACAAAIGLSVDFVVDSIRGNEWSSDPGGLPRWPIKPAIPLAFLLLGLQGCSEAIKRIAVLRGRATSAELGLDGSDSEAQEDRDAG